MADVAIAPETQTDEITRLNQSAMSLSIIGTYVANDTDTHTMIFNSRGKSKLTYVVENPSNKSVVVSLYGAPTATSIVGGAGVMQIGTDITALTTGNIYDTTDDGFPYYIIRCSSAAVPDGETVTIYAYLTPF